MLSPTQKTTDRNLAYLFLRIFFGINVAVHGASRIYSGVPGFATEMVSQFAKTPLPSRMVLFLRRQPPIRGGCNRRAPLHWTMGSAYLMSGFLLIALTFGSTLRQDWTAAGWQLLYAFAYAALLVFREHNVYSVDGARTKTIG